MSLSYEKITHNIYLLDPQPLGYTRQIALYLVIGGESILLVDSGPKLVVDRMLRLLEDVLGGDIRRLKYVALTHIHIDHAGGAAVLVRKLKQQYGVKAEIIAHPRAIKHLVDPTKLWQASLKVLGEAARIQGEPEPAPPEHLAPLSDGEEIDLGDTTVKAVHTPGHASHHITYIVHPDKTALTGDAVAVHYDGRMHPVSPPPFKLDQALQSINKIKQYSPEKITVTHYGVPPEPGVHALEHGEKKIKEWYETIKQLAGQGIVEPEEILEEILRRDPEAKYIVEVRENNPIFRGSALQSIKGILEYINMENTRQTQVGPHTR